MDLEVDLSKRKELMDERLDETDETDELKLTS
jgi:hypothetical protein